HRQPALAGAVVGLLALGIGATVTMLSVVDGVLLRSLPYPDPGRIVVVTDGSHSWPDYRDWTETVPAFETLAAATGMTFTLEEERRDELRGARVSDGFFSLFGATAYRGRLPTADELGSGRRVGVVSHAAWLRRWGGDPRLVGRSLRVDGEPVEVVGVLSPDFVPPEAVTRRAVDLVIPVDPTDPDLDRHERSFAVAGRLAGGATLERAREQLRARAEAFAREYPDQYADETGSPARTFEPVSLMEATTGEVDTALLVLLAGASLLLLVACANAASLLLARGTARRGELAVRRALGGGRGSLLAQLLAEACLLGAAAGAAGLAAAHGGVRVIRALEPGDLPRLEAVTVDVRVAGATLLVALAAGLLAGAVPAWRA
ncbi:MAG: hypothetical protein GWM92_10765, partial [Gemmatimonadetes bacterium]|nr:hypothetical protein [Gemmatimonadota bacterium]NIR79178.1 hypothetical protein [Gemmatimonadota bacterium]NIT87833.1 hypothetical protein [Gemmatimonadota bacterium]NIU31694.1 hypothetical protein [Gemmatimonadota bacterium]NIU36313.1 hypothetical protein [Gemmatimonadota bacterium]